MKETTDEMVYLFLTLCVCFGVMTGCIGLGIGLVWLTFQQAIGVCVLSFGCGVLFGATGGSKRILRSLVKTLQEVNATKE